MRIEEEKKKKEEEESLWQLRIREEGRDDGGQLCWQGDQEGKQGKVRT